MISSCNGVVFEIQKEKKNENQKGLKKNYKLSNLIPWGTGNKVEMFRRKVTGPNAEFCLF